MEDKSKQWLKEEIDKAFMKECAAEAEAYDRFETGGITEESQRMQRKRRFFTSAPALFWFSFVPTGRRTVVLAAVIFLCISFVIFFACSESAISRRIVDSLSRWGRAFWEIGTANLP